MCWCGQFYIDTCLPFGLRSAPHIFNELSTAIHWILQHSYGVQHLLHYLDDFFTAGPADSPVCERTITAMLTLCDKINASIKMSTVEGPTTSLTFLGIQLNTITMEASILSEVHELHWMTHKDSCTKKEPLSLIEKLSFCCKVLPAGRIFLCRMIDLSTSVTELNHDIPLTTEAKLDIQWWINFLPRWSGKSFILSNKWTPSPTLHLYTDASGLHGWGAYWSCQKILFHCDNRSVVDIWDKRSTRATHTMALVRLLHFCAIHHNLNVCVIHVPDVCNDIADALSRFQMDRFQNLAPTANPSPDNIPAWLMQTFMQASCSAGIMELPTPQGVPTTQASPSSNHSVTSTT